MVCNLWRRICIDSEFIDEIDLSAPYIKNFSSFISRMTFRYHIHKITFTNRRAKVEITDIDMRRMLTNWINIKYFDIGRSSRSLLLTDKSITKFEGNLTHLNLSNYTEISGDSIERLIRNSPTLVYLNLMSCIPSENFRKIHLLELILNTCKNLRFLNFLVFTFLDFIQANTLDPIFNKCNLSQLYTNLRHITTQHIKPLAENVGPHLTHLWLEHSSVKDEGLIFLAVSCPNLKVLNLLDDVGISNTGVTALAYNCTKLRFLMLSSQVVTDEAVVQLGTRCALLEYISFFLLLITDTAIQTVIDHCKNVQYLDFKMCRRVSKQFAEKNRNYHGGNAYDNFIRALENVRHGQLY